MTFNDALIILARCQSLKTFEFAAINDVLFERVVPDSPDWDNEDHRLWLRCLTRLSLSSAMNLEFGPLLDMLGAPLLEDLSLTGPLYAEWMEEDFDIDFDEQGNWNHLDNFLKCSDSWLQKIHFEGLPLNTESVVDCLTMKSGIRDLKLDGRMFDGYLASRLTWVPGVDFDLGINLLPDLHSLTIVGCSTTYLSIEELVHMVYSRARYTSLIRTADGNKLRRRQGTGGWIVEEQDKQWHEDTGPMDIDMIYLGDTKDSKDATNCMRMQRLFFTNPIIWRFVCDNCIGICVDTNIRLFPAFINH